ncbi:uncharacterized protein TNCV_1169141 [Trichonephila clavipes]|uniref:Uncharacterized protein n=1 Tax=Trichonephila clavipes TaxID=2585209 RepID=A0A8X6VTA1_TRICX|nr:uncharacterized protein TNCV_1169141 [Trichonephila clavipes]
MGAAIPNILHPGYFVSFEKTQGPLIKVLPVPEWQPIKQLAVSAHFLRCGSLLDDWSIRGVLSLVFVGRCGRHVTRASERAEARERKIHNPRKRSARCRPRDVRDGEQRAGMTRDRLPKTDERARVNVKVPFSSGGLGSRVDRGLPFHEFEPGTTKDPPCRVAMQVKSVELKCPPVGECTERALVDLRFASARCLEIVCGTIATPTSARIVERVTVGSTSACRTILRSSLLVVFLVAPDPVFCAWVPSRAHYFQQFLTAHSERSTWPATPRVNPPAVFIPMIRPLSNSLNCEKCLLARLPTIGGLSSLL